MRVPKYRLHKSTNRAVVTLNGRDHYLGQHGTSESKKAYKRLVAEYLAAIDPALFGRQIESIKIVELIVAYLKHSKSKNGVGLNSEYHRHRIALRPLRELYGEHSPESFGVLQFKALRMHFIDSRDGSLSRNYVNSIMARVVRLFIWAAGEGLIAAKVADTLKAVPGIAKGDLRRVVERPKVQPVSDETVEATLPHLSQTVADMVRVQRLIGCRPSELCNLRVSDIDRTSSDVWVAELVEHKNAKRGKIRKLCFGEKAQAILLKYLFGDSYVFSPRKAEAIRRQELSDARVTPMSCGNRPGTNVKRKPMRVPGECYRRDSYTKAIARACQAAKVEPWSPNQLRHAMATQVRRDKDLGIEASSAVLGHSSLRMTETYAKRDERLAMEVARRLG